jgi:hypothetical protein
MLTLRFDTHSNGTIHLGNISSDDINNEGKFSIDADEYTDILKKAHEIVRKDLCQSNDRTPRYFHLECIDNGEMTKIINVAIVLNVLNCS